MVRFLIALSLLGTLGCGWHVSYVRLNAPPHTLASRPPETVEMFVSSAPQRPFIDVGMIEASRSTWYGKEPLTALREEAADQGCDGVIVLGANDSVVPLPHGYAASVGYRGSCIAWADGVSASSR
jgi:hypothetical protein